MRSLRFTREQFVYTSKIFLMFLVIFLLLQVLLYLVSKSLLPYQVFIDAKGWIVKTTGLVLIETIIVAFISAFLCVFYTHKIMGPVPRIIRWLSSLEASGEFSPIKVRDEDKLKPLAEELNRILAKYLKKGA